MRPIFSKFVSEARVSLKKELIPKPENVNEIIWKEIQFAANIEEEIISAKDRLPSYDIKINALNQKIEEIESKVVELLDGLNELAFLFINRDNLIRPLNLLILDSLQNLDLKDIGLVFRALSIKNDYQILIFTTEKPLNLNKKSIKTVEIIRNQLMRKPDTVKHIKKQDNIIRFL